MIDRSARLKTCATIASALAPKERLEWVGEMREQANELYRAGQHEDALQKYLEVSCEARDIKMKIDEFNLYGVVQALLGLPTSSEDDELTSEVKKHKITLLCNMASVMLRIKVCPSAMHMLSLAM
jgi:hypothetical protein